MRCTPVRFADTNVLLYAVSTAPGERAKAEAARDLLRAGDLAVSVQVLQEFYVQATRASRTDPMAHDDAVALIESFTRFPVATTTVPVLRAALETRRRFQLSYWDAAILESARSIGCAIVLSEDLDVGTDYAGVRVENPFAAA